MQRRDYPWFPLLALVIAVGLTIPSAYSGAGTAGGSEEIPPCNTFSVETPNCRGSSCSETWFKCHGCKSDNPGSKKEHRCIRYPGDACDVAGCTKRKQHAISDDCISQACPVPIPNEQELP